MSGKDYCNCDHAQMLLQAILEAKEYLVDNNIDKAFIQLHKATKEHDKWRKDYQLISGAKR